MLLWPSVLNNLGNNAKYYYNTFMLTFFIMKTFSQHKKCLLHLWYLTVWKCVASLRQYYKLLSTRTWDCSVLPSVLWVVDHQEEHPACKNWVLGCWCGYLSEARCRLSSWFHYIPKPCHLLPHLNLDWFYLSTTGLAKLFWNRGH